MLTRLSVRNLVLITALELDLGPGLTALTGETGAGKSILLDALGVALGGRGERGLVRAGEAQLTAAAGFEPPAEHAVWAGLEALGLEAEPGEPLMFRRVITADGRSRAFINDQPVRAGALRDMGAGLVEVHGQHDGRGLMNPAEHQALLDAFGGLGVAGAGCAQAWRRWREACEQRDRLQAEQAKANADRDFLTEALAELDRLDPRPGEEAELAKERSFMMNAAACLTELQAAAEAVADTGGLEAGLARALAGVERAAAKLNAEAGAPSEALTRAAQALERALIEAGEARDALTDAAERFDVEPGRLERVEERLFALRAVARKHGVDVDALSDLRTDMAARALALEGAEDALKTAEADCAQAQTAFEEAAQALSTARTDAAARLDEAVAAELPPLKLDKARFRTVVSPDPANAGPGGWDKVRFEIAANPGAPFGSLDRIASGGELSRFALALKVCLASAGGPQVLVFDEIDQGVGGAVADAVGRRLAQLARSAQVLVVTHSPQVAARANAHWRIEKRVDGESTVTQVIPLTGEARGEELARMLAGAEITEEARAAARALMSA
ncbi:MAG: DNA repair protein RecN [Maricaulaceae bacterium]